MNFCRRLVLAASMGLAFLMAGPGVARADVNTPVYFVHGFDSYPQTGYNCTPSWQWGTFFAYMKLGSPWNTTAWKPGLFNSHVHRVGYYVGDGWCDDYLGANVDNPATTTPDYSGVADTTTSIDTIAKKLAWLVYKQTSNGTQAVSMIGHSMGGLIIRRAIQGVNDGAAGYPPTLNIKNVVTWSSPHDGWMDNGGGSGPGCNVAGGNQQCIDLQPGSAFMTMLHSGTSGSNPQASQGTDWTIMGSTGDTQVTAASATAMTDVNLRVIYTDTGAPTHGQWLWDGDGEPNDGSQTPRTAKLFHANDTLPYFWDTYDHWMKVTTAKLIQ